MKIYLLNPPFVPRYSRNSRWAARCRGGAIYYPIWLSYAAGVLEKAHHKIRLVDAPAWNWNLEIIKKDIKKFAPEMIVVDSNFQSLSNDINIANEIKNISGAVSVVVGPPASQFPQKILEIGADIVARFEYDFTLLDIADAIENKKKFEHISGISYKENSKIHHNPNRDFIPSNKLNEIPFVSKIYKKYLNIFDYFLDHVRYPMVQIFTGRGCPNQCVFCSWPKTLMGRVYRVRSIENVADEFEYIVENIPEIKEIFIEDDTFTIVKKRVERLCDEIKKRKLDITWSCNARANLDYNTMKKMKDAGCRLLDVGYESGNDIILKNIKKGITLNDSRKFTRDAKKAGLMILADFVFGLIGENKKTAEQTIKFVKEIKPNLVQFSIATPIPGTEFYEWVKENGYLLVNDLEESLDEEGYQKCIISYPEFTKRDMEYFVDKALKKYYLSPSFIPIFMKNIMRKGGLSELNGMIRSARMFYCYIRGKRK